MKNKVKDVNITKRIEKVRKKGVLGEGFVYFPEEEISLKWGKDRFGYVDSSWGIKINNK